MQLTLGHSSLSTPAAPRFARRRAEDSASAQLPAAGAIAIYFVGVLIEAFGLGLIAAYGLVLVGGVIFICGLAIANFGNERWPAPSVSNLDEMKRFVRARLGR
jgi:hypothetical protein